MIFPEGCLGRGRDLSTAGDGPWTGAIRGRRFRAGQM